MSDHHQHKDEKPGWADSRLFRRVLIAALVIAALAAAALGFLPAAHNEEVHFPAATSPFPTEEIPVFFAIFGFIAFMFIVLAGQHLRKIVMRDERYYDERE